MAPRRSLARLHLSVDDRETRPTSRGLTKRLALGLVAATGAGAGLLLSQRPEQVSRSAPVATPVRVTAGQLVASGHVVAHRSARVIPTVFGRIEAVSVKVGQAVTRGQELARLETHELTAALKEANAEVKVATARAQALLRSAGRAQRLQKAGLLAEDSAEAASAGAAVARAELQRAVARREAAEVRLRNALLRAPFAGVVAERTLEVGDVAGPAPGGVGTSSGALRIVALDQLRIEADIEASALARVGLGQPVEIRLESAPDRSLRGCVALVDPQANRQKGTVRVEVSLRDARGLHGLMPDLAAKVVFLGGPACPTS